MSNFDMHMARSKSKGTYVPSPFHSYAVHTYAPMSYRSLENVWDTGLSLELRPDGYPARLPPNTVAHKLLQRNMLLHAWPGRYVVLYDGDGRLDFEFDASVSSRYRVRQAGVYGRLGLNGAGFCTMLQSESDAGAREAGACAQVLLEEGPVLLLHRGASSG
jgi:hypothetical protein